MSIGSCTSCCSGTAGPVAPKPGSDPMDSDGNGTVSVAEKLKGEAKQAAEGRDAAPSRPASFAPATSAALLGLQESAAA